jgi:hypothetical protein
MLKNDFDEAHLNIKLANKFCCDNKLPGKIEIDKCMDLLREGQLKVHKLAPAFDSWSETIHHIKSNDHIVKAPWLIDSKFIQSINQLPGNDLFVEIDWDTECYELSLINIYKIDRKIESVKLLNIWVEGFSDGRKIERQADTDALISSLFLETLPDDPYGTEGVEIRPFQVLFRGLQLGNLVRLTVAAQKKKLCDISLDHLSGTVQNEGTPNLLISNENGDTALHIAAKTGEIINLPDNLVGCFDLFQRGQNGKTVLELALKSGLKDWLLSKLITQFSIAQEYWDELPNSLKVSIADMMRGQPEYWIWRLKIDPEIWDSIPDFLRANTEISQAHKSIWTLRFEANPQEWNQCPAFLQQELQRDEAVIQRLTSSWIRSLENDPHKWNRCPEFLQEDAFIIRTHKNGWLKRLKNHPHEWNQCPAFLQQQLQKDEAVIKKLTSAWIRSLENDPHDWTQCPEFLKADSLIIQAHKNGWIKRLKNHPHEWNQCPDFLQADTQIIQAHKSGWIRLLKREPAEWPKYPPALSNKSELQSARMESELHWAGLQNPDRKVMWIKRLLDQKIVQLEDLPADWHPMQKKKQACLGSPFSFLPNNPLPAYANACFRTLLEESKAKLPASKDRKLTSSFEQARCALALAALREYPWNFSALPADQQSHPLIHKTAFEGWMALLKKHPNFHHTVPDSMRDSPKIQTILKNLRNAKNASLVLQEVSQLPDLNDYEMSYLKLPAKEKQTWKEVTALRLKHWKKQVKVDARAWEKVPKSLQQDGTLLKLMREGLGPQIRQSPTLWSQLPSCYRDDPALQRVHRFATGT